MAKSQAREFKDGVLGKFSDQSLADYWYGDIAAEISVSNAPKMFYECCFELLYHHNALVTLSFGHCSCDELGHCPGHSERPCVAQREQLLLKRRGLRGNQAEYSPW